MKKITPAFFTAAMIIGSIQASADASMDKFSDSSAEREPADSITVVGHIQNITGNMPRTLIINECDFFAGSGKAICEIDSDGAFYKRIPLSYPHTFTVNYNKNFINAFAAPGDSVYMEVDASVHPVTVIFSGDKAAINQQYNPAFQQMSEFYGSVELPSDTVALEDYLPVFKEYVKAGRDSIDSYARANNLTSDVVSMLYADDTYSLANLACGYQGRNEEEKRAFFLDPIFDIFNEENTKVMIFPYHIIAIMRYFPDVLERAPKGTIRDLMYIADESVAVPERSMFSNPKYYDRIYGQHAKENISIDDIKPGSMTVYVDGEIKNLSDENPIAWLIKEYKGAPIYLDVSATWCGPCRVGLKGSESLREYFKDSGLKFAVIWLRSPREDWVKVAPTITNAIQIFIDDEDMENRIMGHLKMQGFPTYLMIDKDGKIRKEGVPHYLSPELPEFLNQYK